MSHKTVNLSKQVANFQENGKADQFCQLYIFILATDNDVSCYGNGCWLRLSWALSRVKNWNSLPMRGKPSSMCPN